MLYILRVSVVNDISPETGEKIQLGELDSGPDSEGCGDPADPWAIHLCFSQLAGGRAETSIVNLQALLATNFQKQAGLLEALNKYDVTPVIVDRPPEKWFFAQHNGSKSKGNSDNWLETWAARSCDPWSCSYPKATPDDTQLMVPGGLLDHDDKNSMIIMNP
ncbi:hypothetical protein DSO57_1008502 [Entomophthora muscae]|uniref:Uncharacterized protein n=1 Tax=Entomophthora muscae TaxID=34485 RepID=A0ACC2TID1_9FUNG|nr:hypothetical protein DSO57_1008502 [Entomophthora muscae]